MNETNDLNSDQKYEQLPDQLLNNVLKPSQPIPANTPTVSGNICLFFLNN